MKAVVFHEFGGPEVLQTADWREPEVGPSDVLVAVHAVSVGRTLDVEVRRRGADFNVQPPRVLGSDPAGVVAAIGADVATVRPGDRVQVWNGLSCGSCDMCRREHDNACRQLRLLGVHTDGGYAEYVAAPERNVFRVPNHVPLDAAASLGLNYPVALNLLRAAAVRPGETVLVMAAAGGLGLGCLALAKALGARVIAAAGAGWKLDRLTGLGADHVVDYSRPGWDRQVRVLTGGRGVEVVLENISSPDLFAAALGCLGTYGRLVTCGTHGGGQVEVDMRQLYRNTWRIIGEKGAPLPTVRDTWAMLAERRVAPPPVEHRFALEDAAAAHHFAAGRQNFGRAVLIVREEPQRQGPASWTAAPVG